MLRVQGSGSRNQRSRCRVQGLERKIQGSGFRDQGSGVGFRCFGLCFIIIFFLSSLDNIIYYLSFIMLLIIGHLMLNVHRLSRFCFLVCLVLSSLLVYFIIVLSIIYHLSFIIYGPHLMFNVHHLLWTCVARAPCWAIGLPNTTRFIALPSSSQFKNTYFTEMCSGSEAGSYFFFTSSSLLSLQVLKGP